MPTKREVPPRTRGCTPGGPSGAGAEAGSPAHAGMHPRVRTRGSSAVGFPRARGDAPPAAGGRVLRLVVPPRTRGCTVESLDNGQLPNGSPAHAGMHLSPFGVSPPRSWFPRARGDAPPGSRPNGPAARVPPRTRGCTLAHPRHPSCALGSPAHAGMHPGIQPLTLPLLWFPRARGDAPRDRLRRGWCRRVPPRTRGCTREGPPRPVPTSGSPAHAGMHPMRTAPSRSCWRFPRARGDAPCAGCSSQLPREVPPRTRGCTPRVRYLVARVRGSPAHAGMHP